MTTFQLVALPALAVLLVVTAVAATRHRITPRVALAWMVLWLAAAAGIAFPELLVTMAHALGIGRGADLVFYVFILATFVAFFVTYLRFRRLDEQLTKIVRHMAILNGEREEEQREPRPLSRP